MRKRIAPVLALLLPLAAACGGPFLVFPGGSLSGEVASEPAGGWSPLESGVFALETRPSDPYSVNVNVVVRDGRLYIDPAEGRKWHTYIVEDPRVRVRIHGRVYPLTAVRVSDATELEGFAPERVVYRLDRRGE